MKLVPILTLAAAALLTACATPYGGPSAIARLEPTKGSTVQGTVRFAEIDGDVLVEAEVTGLTPNTVHGFHVHEKGDCSSGDGMSAGGHFNPLGKAHGAHGTAEHHAGDLISLQADAHGVAKLRYTTRSISVGGGVTDIVGHGLIVHRDPDDFHTQPTGNAGPRLACAVITRN